MKQYRVIIREDAGATLLELLLATTIGLISSLAIIALVGTALRLYTRNYALNDSHAGARRVSNKVGRTIHEAVQAPTLLSATGSANPGSGPAAGVHCLIQASDRFYYTNGSTSLAGSSVSVQSIPADQFRPAAGDYVQMQYYDHSAGLSGTFFTRIDSVTSAGGGNQLSLNFQQPIANYFTPGHSSGNTIRPNQPFLILTASSFVAVPAQNGADLRFYPRARSVAEHGQAAFDDPANFRIIANLMPRGGESQCLPFSYSDPERRYVDLDTRVMSARYSNLRMGTFNRFASVRTAFSYRSSLQRLLQPL